MILDSSAVVAAIREEGDTDRLLRALAAASYVGIGPPTAFESSLVLVRRYGVAGRAILGRFLEQNEVVSVPFGELHWSVAAEAFIRFGKGRHPAALNYGDCMTYATAQIAEAPLLFVGNDFAQTDIATA